MSDEEDEIDMKIRFKGEVHKLFDVPVGLSNRELLIQIIMEICPQELSKIPKLKLANEREISFAKPKFNLKKYLRRFGGGENRFGVVRGVLEFGEQKKIEKEYKKKEGKIQDLEKELDEKKVEAKNLKKRLLQENEKVKKKYKEELKKTRVLFNKNVEEHNILIRRLKEMRKDIDIHKEREECLEDEVRKLKGELKKEREKVTVLAAELRKKELAFAEPMFEKHPILLEALAMCSAFYFVKKHAAEYFAKFGVPQIPLWRICTFCCEVRRRSVDGAKHNYPRWSKRCLSTSCHPFCCMCLFTRKKSWKCGNAYGPCKPILIPQEYRKFPSQPDNAENCVFPTQTYENSSYWFKGDRAKLLLEKKRERKVSSLIERRVPVEKWDQYLSDCKIKLSFSSLAARLEKGCGSMPGYSGSNKSTFIIIDPLNGGVTCFDNSIEMGKEQLLKYAARKYGQHDPRKAFLLSTEGMVCLENKDVSELNDLRYGKNIVPLIWCELSTN